MLSPSHNKPTINNAFICPETELRNNSMNSKRPRRLFSDKLSNIQIYVEFPLDFNVCTEDTKMCLEVFEYLSAVPMSIDFIEWGLNHACTHFDNYTINIYVGATLLKMQTIHCYSTDFSVGTKLIPKGHSFIFTKGMQFSIQILPKGCCCLHDYFIYRLIRKTNEYKIIQHCGHDLSCIRKIGMTLYI